MPATAAISRPPSEQTINTVALLAPPLIHRQLPAASAEIFYAS
jgi:hypothetical protein